MKWKWTWGQHWVKPIQRLNGGLFMHTEHRRMTGRIEVQADDVGSFGFKVRIVASFQLRWTAYLLIPKDRREHITRRQRTGLSNRAQLHTPLLAQHYLIDRHDVLDANLTSHVYSRTSH